MFHEYVIEQVVERKRTVEQSIGGTRETLNVRETRIFNIENSHSEVSPYSTRSVENTNEMPTA